MSRNNANNKVSPGCWKYLSEQLTMKRLLSLLHFKEGMSISEFRRASGMSYGPVHAFVRESGLFNKEEKAKKVLLSLNDTGLKIRDCAMMMLSCVKELLEEKEQ